MSTMRKDIVTKSKIDDHERWHSLLEDIPVTNFDRAIKFYSAVRGNEVRRMLEARTVLAPSSSTRKAIGSRSIRPQFNV